MEVGICDGIDKLEHVQRPAGRHVRRRFAHRHPPLEQLAPPHVGRIRLAVTDDLRRFLATTSAAVSS